MSAHARSIDLKSTTRAWEKLQASSGIGPIRDEEDYEERAALLNTLIDTVRDDEAHPLAGLLEIVGELIENYENTHYPIPEAEPRATLHFLMEEHGLKQSDLAGASVNRCVNSSGGFPHRLLFDSYSIGIGRSLVDVFEEVCRIETTEGRLGDPHDFPD